MVYSTDMNKNITAETKNSDIVLNHDEYGLTLEAATALIIERMRVTDEAHRRNTPSLLNKVPAGGWTDADKVKR